MAVWTGGHLGWRPAVWTSGGRLDGGRLDGRRLNGTRPDSGRPDNVSQKFAVPVCAK